MEERATSSGGVGTPTLFPGLCTPERDRPQLRVLDACLQLLQESHQQGQTVVPLAIATSVGDCVPAIEPGMLIAQAMDIVHREQEQLLLPSRADTPSADRTAADHLNTGPRSDVRRLLVAYESVLDAVNRLPPVVMVRCRHRAPRPLRRICALPRPRWLLRYLVASHVSLRIDALTRRFSARIALGQASESDAPTAEALAGFRRSLPPVRTKQYIIVLVLAALVLGRLTLRGVSLALSTLGTGIGFSVLNWTKHKTSAPDLLNGIGNSLEPSLTSLNRTADALLSANPVDLLLVALVLAIASYAVLRPLMPAFRLKRMLFNLYPDIDGYLSRTTARWHVPHKSGVYELEVKLFAELGMRPPREFPLDVVVPALVMLFPAWVALSGMKALIAGTDTGVRLEAVALTAPTVSLVSLRLGWLSRSWRRRLSGRPVSYVPYEAQIRGSEEIVKLRSPFGVAIANFVMLVLGLPLALFAAVGWFMVNGELPTSLFVAVICLLTASMLSGIAAAAPTVWWHHINRELRDLGRARRSSGLGRLPVLSLMAAALGVLVGIVPILIAAIGGVGDGGPPASLIAAIGGLLAVPPLVSLYRTCGRIRRAQRLAGLSPTLRAPVLLLPGVVMFPLLFAYLQRQLNRVWAVEAQAIPDTPPVAPLPALGGEVAPELRSGGVVGEDGPVGTPVRV